MKNLTNQRGSLFHYNVNTRSIGAICLLLATMFLFAMVNKNRPYAEMPMLGIGSGIARISSRSHSDNKTSLYPNDFSFSSNIRSSDLVEKWSTNYSAYCSESAQTISAIASQMYITRIEQDVIYLRIRLFDIFGNPKTDGGDVIFIRAESDEYAIEARDDRRWLQRGNLAGTVEDHLNGTYTARIKMLWKGPVVIRASVPGKSGIGCLRMRAMQKYGISVFAVNTPYGIHFLFEHNGEREKTRCAPTTLIPGYDKLCNYTEQNFNLSWFCGHPKNPLLNCSHVLGYHMLPYNIEDIVPGQPSDEVINVPIITDLDTVVTIEFDNTDTKQPTEQCSTSPSSGSWTESYPTGYALNGHWMQANCIAKPLSVRLATKCLRNTSVVLFGDSTIRQYADFLYKWLQLSKEKETTRYFKHYTSNEHGIIVKWRKHEMPYYNSEINSFAVLNSTGYQLRLLADNPPPTPDLVIILTYNTHLQAFSIDVFRSRIDRLVEALEYLIRKIPYVKIIVKGPHSPISTVKWFDPRVALLFRDIIFECFKELRHKVIYLDTMSVSIAHDNYLLHPEGQTMDCQVDQLLNFIC